MKKETIEKITRRFEHLGMQEIKGFWVEPNPEGNDDEVMVLIISDGFSDPTNACIPVTETLKNLCYSFCRYATPDDNYTAMGNPDTWHLTAK